MNTVAKKPHTHQKTSDTLHVLAGTTLTGRLGGLLGQKVLVNVGEDTSLCDGDVTEKFVEFLVVSDGELQMTWDDTGLLVVTGSVTGKFEDFSSEVFENGSEVDGST